MVEKNAAKIDAVNLKPDMTLLNGCTINIGTIIGTEIFISGNGTQDWLQGCTLSMDVRRWFFNSIVHVLVTKVIRNVQKLSN